MASSSSSTPPPGETSYAAMDPPPDKDLESIGAHCEFEYCRQLDFLPFKCLSCRSTFCLDHRTETAHQCAHAGEWARNRQRNTTDQASTTAGGRTLKPNVYTGQQCSHPKCKTLIHTLNSTGVHCQTCNRDYCLKHRFEEEHDCKTLAPLGARPRSSLPSAQAQAKTAFDKLRLWSKDKTSSLTSTMTPKPSTASSRAADVVALKRTAKGDPKVAPDRRIYLHVEAEATPSTSTTTTTSKSTKNLPLYFDKVWTIGRLLDSAARNLQVKNENNSTQGEEGRLRVFYVEGGRVLGFSERVGDCLANGGTIVLLRGVRASE